MSLYQEMQDLQLRLREVLDDAQELTTRIAHLEEQNRSLQEDRIKLELDKGGLNALHQLYNDGFHVCHAHFAENREEDCLFCLSLLHGNN